MWMGMASTVAPAVARVVNECALTARSVISASRDGVCSVLGGRSGLVGLGGHRLLSPCLAKCMIWTGKREV
jgi:hypothetical protein